MRATRGFRVAPFLVLLIGAAITGCSGPEARLDPEPPAAQGPAPEVDPLPSSRISVPVEVSLESLRRIVERELPSRLGSLEDRRAVNDNDRVEAAFEIERGGIDASFERGRARLSTVLSYRARAWYDPPLLPAMSTSCGTGEGEPEPRLAATVESPLTLDREWRLQSDVQVTELGSATKQDRDRCTVTIFNFDVTGHVIEGARSALAGAGARADSAVAALDVRSDFAGWWRTISEPIRLTDGVWLALSPEGVGRGMIQGTGDEVGTTMSVQLQPRVWLGDRPEVQVQPLPPLDSVSRPPGVEIVTEVVAPWPEVTRRISDELVGRIFSAGGRQIEVAEVQLGGVGDGRLFLEARVKGDVAGLLFLVGTPVHDAESDEIRVPDLEFDLRTRDALAASAAWIAEVGFAQTFRERARWSATPAREWAVDQVEKGFNARISSQVHLEGSVDEVTIVEVLVGIDDLRVRTRVTGQARLVVDAGGGG